MKVPNVIWNFCNRAYLSRMSIQKFIFSYILAPGAGFVFVSGLSGGQELLTETLRDRFYYWFQIFSASY